MATLKRGFDDLEERLTGWMARHAITALRLSLGVVFLWFGFLKYFSGLSPAEDLAARTIGTLTFGLVKPAVALPLLATWECAIGLGFITGKFLRATLALLFAQMAGTALPLFFFPAEAFTRVPYAATLEGQYIIKNLVLVSAGLAIGATLRGGSLVARARDVVAPAPPRPAPASALAPGLVALCATPNHDCPVVHVQLARLPLAVRLATLRTLT